jgi:hypothetical protein
MAALASGCRDLVGAIACLSPLCYMVVYRLRRALQAVIAARVMGTLGRPASFTEPSVPEPAWRAALLDKLETALHAVAASFAVPNAELRQLATAVK